MKQLLILFFLIQIFRLQADELPFFEINCNLRNADFILQGIILDKQGNILVTHDYSQKKIAEKNIQHYNNVFAKELMEQLN